VAVPALSALWLIGWIFFLLPEPLKRALAWLIAWALDSLGARRKVIEQNLEFAFPLIRSRPAELVRRRQEAYRHLARLVLEILMLFGPLPRFTASRVVIRGRENLTAALALGKGVLLLSSHVGNWEVMAATALPLNLDFVFVTKRLKPAWLHRAVERARLRSRVVCTYEPKTLKDVLRALKAGHAVGFVIDQFAGAPVGVRVPFFGVPVGTTTAIAALAKRTGAAVVPVVNYREPDGSFVVEIRPALPWRAEEVASRELAVNTAAYVAEIEGDIKAHPGQWLWTHRRFKGDLSPLKDGEWDAPRARH
jgi:KDO2-lipid IV(A) lauroyltransferase